MDLEQVIFANLLHNEEYARQVIPHLKKEYFHDSSDEVVFTLIDDYIQTFNGLPDQGALLIELSNKSGLPEQVYSDAKGKIERLNVVDRKDNAWLLDRTEKFCQDKAIFNSIRESIKIIDDPVGQLSREAIPKLLQEALSVSFDTSIGHSYTENAEERYEYYHRKYERVPFDIEYLNKVTKGGLPKKTLTILMGGIGAGKSLCMCHMASANFMMGKNVLYITMELAEEEVTKRIDANLLNVTLDELMELPKETFDKRIDRIKEKTPGRLIVKEYPTSGAGSANFRHLLNELRIKKNFTPDIIYIDYLNICASSRFKNNGNVGSYMYIKAIAEELRGLAVEFEVPIVTATQVNREGLNSSDLDMTNTSESIGAPASADVMLAIIATEELLELGQYMFKQLKNRFSDIMQDRCFVVGVDKRKMRLYDAEDNAQSTFNDTPVMDTTPSGKQDLRSKFSGFK